MIHQEKKNNPVSIFVELADLLIGKDLKKSDI